MRGNGPLTIAATRAGVWVFIPKLNDVVVIDAATRLVAQRASCTARTDEIEPDPAVFELDGRSAEPSPPAHDNPAHGSLEDGDEIALDVRIQANGCAKREEVIGNGPVRCRPSQVEIAYREVASAAPRREIIEQQAPMASAFRQLETRFARPGRGGQRVHGPMMPLIGSCGR